MLTPQPCEQLVDIGASPLRKGAQIIGLIERHRDQPVWREAVCAEGNTHILIGNEPYMLSADGLLMPAKKDQAPPDLRYFKQSGK